MPQNWTVLRIYIVGARMEDQESARRLLDRLARRRPVSAGEYDWRVTYEVKDASAAMRMCEQDLASLDRNWFRILDFEIQRPLRRIGQVP